MNKNIQEATDQASDRSTETKAKAVHSFMTPKKQAVEEPPKEMEVVEPEKTITTPVIPEPHFLDNKPNGTNRKKRIASVDYPELFVGRYELDSRQGLHVEKGTIATIKRVIHGIGDPRLTVSGFVENVLKHHFDIYKEEINRLFDEKLRKPVD